MNLANRLRQLDGTKTGEIKVVAIDGHGGSGKSTLAAKLAEELGAEVVHTDDFASPENPKNWWPDLIDKVLDPIKNGKTSLSYERSSWAPDHHPEPVKNQPVTPIVILEGVSSARKEFRPYLTYSVWVETPKELCIERGIERNGEAMREQWEEWWNSEEEYIANHDPKSYVREIVSGY